MLDSIPPPHWGEEVVRSDAGQYTSTTLRLIHSPTPNSTHLLVCLDYLNLWVDQSSLRVVVLKTCCLHYVPVTTDVRIHSPPIFRCLWKIAAGPIFPAKKNGDKLIIHHWSFFYNINIWNNNSLYKYSSLESRTLPVYINYLQNNLLSSKRTHMPRLFP